MYIDDDGNEYEREEDYLRTLKKEEYYHFSIPFEYIKKNYGDGNYDIETAQMEIDVNWDDMYCGYRISHNCPDMYKINPDEGNGDEEEFYDNCVEHIVLEKLEELGIGPTSLV